MRYELYWKKQIQTCVLWFPNFSIDLCKHVQRSLSFFMVVPVDSLSKFGALVSKTTKCTKDCLENIYSKTNLWGIFQNGMFRNIVAILFMRYLTFAFYRNATHILFKDNKLVNLLKISYNLFFKCFFQEFLFFLSYIGCLPCRKLVPSKSPRPGRSCHPPAL